MFDIGSMELLIVAVVALLVVGPKDLPQLLRNAAQMVRRVRAMVREFRLGLDQLVDEIEEGSDPFREERKKAGLTPHMSPEEITAKIMAEKSRTEIVAEIADAMPVSDGKSGANKPKLTETDGRSKPAPRRQSSEKTAKKTPKKAPEKIEPKSRKTAKPRPSAPTKKRAKDKEGPSHA